MRRRALVAVATCALLAACGSTPPRAEAPTTEPPAPPLPTIVGAPLDGPHASCFPGFTDFEVRTADDANHVGSGVCRDFGDRRAATSLGAILHAGVTHVSYGTSDDQPSGCYLTVRTQAGWFLRDMYCGAGFTSWSDANARRLEVRPSGVDDAARLVLSARSESGMRDGTATESEALIVCGVGRSGVPTCVTSVTRYFHHASEDYLEEDEEPPPDIQWSSEVEVLTDDVLEVRGPGPSDAIAEQIRRARPFREPGRYRLVFP